MYVGKNVDRVDAYDKVTGRAKYTEDLVSANSYVAKILHSTIAHGKVISIDTSEAEKIEDVVKIVTCFDVPKWGFPTAGHPWSTDPSHQDKADRNLLNTHVRYYGDDVAVVIAKNSVACSRAIEKIKVEYEEYEAAFDQMESMKGTNVPIHDDCPKNILAHTSNNRGDYQEAIK